MDSVIPDELKFVFGAMSFKEYIDAKGISYLQDKITDAFGVTKAVSIITFARDMHKVWLEYTEGARRLVMCINTTRVHWRSKVQIALLGL